MKKRCDYISISETLLENIKSNNKAGIKKMMAFEDKDFWSEGSSWTTIQKSASQSLDTISDLKTLNTFIGFNKESPISYAVVTILLSQREKIRDFIQVRFSHPNSPFGCRIQSFNFIRTGSSNKINSKPIF